MTIGKDSVEIIGKDQKITGNKGDRDRDCVFAFPPSEGLCKSEQNLKSRPALYFP
ncbi:MAG: hypothetical protein ACFB5Z_06500 [Elainellaceae cyanobacterium]